MDPAPSSQADDPASGRRRGRPRMARRPVAPRPGVEVLERQHALQILIHLAEQPLRLLELQQLGAGSSRTVLRRIRELQEAGWVVRVDHSGVVRYRLADESGAVADCLKLLDAHCATRASEAASTPTA